MGSAENLVQPESVDDGRTFLDSRKNNAQGPAAQATDACKCGTIWTVAPSGKKYCRPCNKRYMAKHKGR
jgi:hypothetical protein